MIKVVPYLKESLPPGYFSDAASVTGRTIIYPAKANEPIFESKLAPSTLAGGGVAALVTPKKRAMAVKVDKFVGVSGFVHPGNRVDVLVTISKGERAQSPTTKIVLENILVLATGTDLENTGKQEKPSQVDVITLEVTPEEGERLALAATEGKLQLALAELSPIPSSCPDEGHDGNGPSGRAVRSADNRKQQQARQGEKRPGAGKLHRRAHPGKQGDGIEFQEGGIRNHENPRPESDQDRPCPCVWPHCSCSCSRPPAWHPARRGSARARRHPRNLP